jgi:hypothetical protein
MTCKQTLNPVPSFARSLMRQRSIAACVPILLEECSPLQRTNYVCKRDGDTVDEVKKQERLMVRV